MVAVGLGLAAISFQPGFLNQVVAGLQEGAGDEVARLPGEVVPAGELFEQNILAPAADLLAEEMFAYVLSVGVVGMRLICVM